MGKVKFSAVVSEIRNKVGDSVYSRNRYGAYIREYVIPTPTSTTYQQALRDSFGTLSANWSALSVDQRLQWSERAASLKKVDVFSNQYSSNGFQFYIQLNQERVLVGGVATATPPALSSIPLFSGLNVAYDNDAVEMIISLASSGLTSNQALVIRATTGLSQGKTFFKKDYRVIKILSDPTTLPYNAYTDYTTRFGGFINGTRVGVQVYAVDKVSGLRTQGLSTYFDVGVSYNTISSDYFAELPTQPSDSRKSIINDYVNSEQYNSLAQADRCLLFASEYQDNAVVSVVYPTTTKATEVGSPSWTTQGYTGASGKYLNSQYDPTIDGINFLQNNAWFAWYCRTNVDNDGYEWGAYTGGQAGNYGNPRTSNQVSASVNSNTQTLQANFSSIGMYVCIRISSTQMQIWRNGVSLGTFTTNSIALVNLKIYLFCLNGNGTATNFSTRQVPYIAWGGGSLNVALHYTNTFNYLTAIGAT